jgi:hypothetical protein
MNNPMIGEAKNPLKGGRLVGPMTPEHYFDNGVAKRGDTDFVMSRSELMEFWRCPRRWYEGYESEETKPQEWGSLIDGLVLGTADQFKARFAITPETYKSDKGEVKPWNWNANVCKEWREDHPGKQIVKFEDSRKATQAAAAILADDRLSKIVKNSEHQVMAVSGYNDLETGLEIPLKVLIDIVPNEQSGIGKSLVDLKTCNSAGLHAWKRAVFEHGYHVQGALYLDVYTAATGEDRCDFRHILQESYEPYQTGLRCLSLDFIELGRLKYIAALKRYCMCLSTGVWPGYDETAPRALPDGWPLVEPEAWMVEELE